MDEEDKLGGYEDNLQSQMDILRVYKKRETELKTSYDIQYQMFLDANLELITEQKALKETITDWDAHIRATMLEAFKVTGAKKTGSGVGVRIIKKLEYDPLVAYDWAMEHKMALALDRRAFEKIAKASPIEFVKIEDVPQVTIPKIGVG